MQRLIDNTLAVLALFGLVAALALSARAATATTTVYVSSERARTYHVRLDCPGLKKSRDEGRTRQGDEENAIQRGLKRHDCKARRASWTRPVDGKEGRSR